MERTEKIGLGIATAGHILLFGVLSAGFLSTPNPLKLNSPPMDVSLVDEIALEATAPEVSQTPPPSEAPELGPTEEPAPSPPAPEPEPIPAPPPPAPAPKPAPKPEPAPKPVERAKPKPKPKPAEAKPQPAKPAPPAERAKPAPAKEKPKPAATKPAQKPAAKPAPKPAATGKGKAETARGSRLGPDFLKGIEAEAPARSPAPAAAMGPQQKAALDRAISEQIYPHLRLPSGADVEQLVALLDVKLDRDGRVIGKPTVIDIQGETASNRPQVSVYKERAIQAVMAASPFQNLPDQYYEQWKWLSPLRVYARKAR